MVTQERTPGIEQYEDHNGGKTKGAENGVPAESPAIKAGYPEGQAESPVTWPSAEGSPEWARCRQGCGPGSRQRQFSSVNDTIT